MEDSEVVDQPETSQEEEPSENASPDKSSRSKLLKLPLARVKSIMKSDPDCQLISQDAIFLVTKASELFIELLAKETVNVTNQSKRKTVMKRDLEKVVETAANLCFLDGMLDS
ncbi:PREDICTED: DNA polymerase epsilon subunit 4 [Nicrophorus vespilloides]|uniref:DNA polymerase epsilon subunit 4 n=1 Tax=Nicrophorus vespilloides TaxID=110193 RepID=A0ABM1MZ38_NICVS|nr:PREDICTED: DNA polymerase epsilon subunit 4 [Nicrophorus vespilloides]